MREGAREAGAAPGAERLARAVDVARMDCTLAEATRTIDELLRGEGDDARWLPTCRQSRDGSGAMGCERVGAWLELSAALADPPDPLAALGRNGELGGFAKLALAPHTCRVHVRAELPTDVDGALGRRRRDTEAAIAKVDGGRGWRPTGSGDALAPGALAELCDVAGWPCVAVDAHALVVDLGLRNQGVQARIVWTQATAAVRVSAELDRIPLPIADPCGTALAVFLLRAAAIVRLVRPVLAERSATAATVGFEVVYASSLDARELAHALAALRVAVEMTSREVAVLARDPAIARAYLALDEPPSRADPAGSAPTPSATLAKGEA